MSYITLKILQANIPTHSSVLAWRIPWTEDLGGLQSMGSQRVGHNWVTSHVTHHIKCNVPGGRILNVFILFWICINKHTYSCYPISQFVILQQFFFFLNFKSIFQRFSPLHVETDKVLTWESIRSKPSAELVRYF